MTALVTGRPAPPEQRPELGRHDSATRLLSLRATAARLILGLLIALGLAFLAVPVVSLLFYASPTTLLAKLAGPLGRQALTLSLTTTLAALILTIATGTPMAWWLAKHDFPGRRLVDVGLQLTIVLPASVAGLGLLLVFGRSGLLGGALGYAGIQIPFTAIAVVLAQAFTAVALYVSSARQALEAVDDQLIAASRTLGVSVWRTFWRVVLPLAAPGVLTGMALGWARALGEFGATLVFAGNLPGRTQTMPLAIYVALESDLTTAVAVAVLLLAVALIPLLLVQYAGHRLTGATSRRIATPDRSTAHQESA